MSSTAAAAGSDIGRVAKPANLEGLALIAVKSCPFAARHWRGEDPKGP